MTRNQRIKDEEIKNLTIDIKTLLSTNKENLESTKSERGNETMKYNQEKDTLVETIRSLMVSNTALISERDTIEQKIPATVKVNRF